MNSKKSIYRLLQHALLEIRHEAGGGGDLKNIAALSDLFHNVPLALAKDDADYDGLLSEIIQKASGNDGLSRWIEGNKA